MPPIRPRYLPLAANLQPWRALAIGRAIRRLCLGICLCLTLVVLAIMTALSQYTAHTAQLQTQHSQLLSATAASRNAQLQLDRNPVQLESLINAQRLHACIALLQQHLPPQMRITHITIEQSILIGGTTFSKPALTVLTHALNNHPLIDSAHFQHVQQHDHEWEFTLVMQFNWQHLAKVDFTPKPS